jgi:hypothetical protein
VARAIAPEMARRIIAIEEVNQAGGLNKFEEKMFRLAKLELEDEDGNAGLALYIIYYLAEAVGAT